MLKRSELKFSPGELIVTPGCLQAFHDSGDKIVPFLLRHLSGDWGNLDEHDRQANQDALTNGLRLLSAYTLSNGTRIWVITEADRTSTCFLTPEEY